MITNLIVFGSVLTVSYACVASGVCGGASYCAPPAPAPCAPASCQPGYSCGQYGCARNRARSALTQKVEGILIADFPDEKPVSLPEKKKPKTISGGSRNIFGLTRGEDTGAEVEEDVSIQKIPPRPTDDILQTIDNSTLDKLTNPNFIFRECCEQRGLPDACLNKCHYNTYTKDALQAMYFKTDGCPLEAAADMQFCAAQGRDHSQCCRQNGVTSTLAGQKCLTFCDQRPDRVTKLDYSYVPCYDRFENMKHCFYNEIKRKAEEQFGKRRLR